MSSAQRLLIYVAGPLTSSGLMWSNIRNACQAGMEIRKCGHFAYVPHLSAFWAMTSDEAESIPESDWMEHCFAMLQRCDALFRLPGESRGSDLEVERAKSMRTPVYHNYTELPQLTFPFNAWQDSDQKDQLAGLEALARRVRMQGE